MRGIRRVAFVVAAAGALWMVSVRAQADIRAYAVATYQAYAWHSYGCPGSDDPGCGFNYWAAPVMEKTDPVGLTETWTETFTLSGGTGSALFTVNGSILRTIGGYGHGEFTGVQVPTATISNQEAGNTYALSMNGADLAHGSQRYDADHLIDTFAEPESFSATFSVAYDVPFTLDLLLVSYARAADMAVVCGPPPHGGPCTYEFDVWAEQSFQGVTLGIPAGAVLASASGTVYPLSAVPEPASAVMLGLGALALLSRRWTRGRAVDIA